MTEDRDERFSTSADNVQTTVRQDQEDNEDTENPAEDRTESISTSADNAQTTARQDQENNKDRKNPPEDRAESIFASVDNVQTTVRQDQEDNEDTKNPAEDRTESISTSADNVQTTVRQDHENNEDAENPVDDDTVIFLDQTSGDHNDTDHQTTTNIAWMDQTTGPEMEQRRKSVLIRELRRVQRASFFHFLLLCLIPTALLVIVITTAIGENEECYSDISDCELEPRRFLNAYTTRCVCEAVDISY